MDDIEPIAADPAVSSQSHSSAVQHDLTHQASHSGVGRLRSLDGMRGLGALIVVLYHMLLVVPAMSLTVLPGPEPATPPPTFSLVWWLYRTPLRLLWAGNEAVLIFFVLSGLVLTLPLISHFSWKDMPSYYLRRLLRLYVPVWAAVAIALASAKLVTRDPTNGASTWLMTHTPPNASTVVHDAVLLFGTSNLDSPLWSLTWEMWFSLLLPIMFVVLRCIRVERWWGLAILVLGGISAMAQQTSIAAHLPKPFLAKGFLQYLSVFAIGMTIAFAKPRIVSGWKRWMQSSTARPRAAWPLVVVTVVLIPCSTYIGPTAGPGVRGVLDLLELVGVTLSIVVAMMLPAARKALESRPIAWAGSRSFSIYLIHEPIVVSLALAVHATAALPWIFIGLAAVPLILLASELFYRIIEHPAHRLSQTLGHRLRPNTLDRNASVLTER